MKRLFLAFLFLAAAATPFRANAENVCPAGSLSGSVNIATNKGNTTYTADNCGIGASASLVFDASGIPQGVLANRGTVEFLNSNVAARAVVLFNLPTSNSISSRLIPLTILIKGNTFAALSQLQFSAGVLPPESIVTIESNEWEKLQTLTPNPITRLLQFGTLTVLQNVTLSVISNTFGVRELTNGTDVSAIFVSSMNLGLSSVVSFSKNTFDLEGFRSRNCYGLYGNTFTFTMKSDSKLLVDDNLFTLSNGLAWVFPRLDFDSSTGVRTTFSIQRNTLNTRSENAHQFAYHQEIKGNVMNGILKDNVMSCVGCSGKWEFTRLLQFGDRQFEIARNKLTVAGGNVPQIPFTYTELELATLSISDNTLIAPDQVLTNKNPWLDLGNVAMRKQCRILILRNTFDAQYMPTRPAINTGNNFNVEKLGTTRVFICGNDFFGTTPFSNDYVALYMTSDLAGQMRPEQECAGLFLPYNATYEPMDNSSPQSQAQFGMVYCILAAVLSLCVTGMMA